MKARVPPAPAHVFVAPSGQALPRWLEAFPRLRCVKTGEQLGALDSVSVVWLRLDSSVAALTQVESLVVAAPGARIVVLADQPDDEQALPLFAAGIRGYCNAHSTAANLRQVAQAVVAGGLWVGAGLMARLLAATRRSLPPESAARPETDSPLARLTRRESDVAQQIARGATNKEVARALGISERTVKAHTGAIFDKLGARDRLQLALMINGHDPSAATPPPVASQPSPTRLPRRGPQPTELATASVSRRAGYSA